EKRTLPTEEVDEGDGEGTDEGEGFENDDEEEEKEMPAPEQLRPAIAVFDPETVIEGLTNELWMSTLDMLGTRDDNRVAVLTYENVMDIDDGGIDPSIEEVREEGEVPLVDNRPTCRQRQQQQQQNHPAQQKHSLSYIMDL
ncbi:hypothetical protein BGX23_003616, partial [Mortierella sp. AD031]